MNIRDGGHMNPSGEYATLTELLVECPRCRTLGCSYCANTGYLLTPDGGDIFVNILTNHGLKVRRVDDEDHS